MKNVIFLALTCLISACQQQAYTPHRQSTVGRTLDVPPQLVSINQQGLKVPGEERYSYQQALREAAQQGSSKPKVLPELHGITQQDKRIEVPVAVDEVWWWVRDYLRLESLDVSKEDSLEGLMETVWQLEMQEQKAGLSALLSSLGLTDQGAYHRYRLQFSRHGQGTAIEIQHRQREEIVKEGAKYDVPDYQWQEREGDDEVAQRFARRLALFIAQKMQTP